VAVVKRKSVWSTFYRGGVKKKTRQGSSERTKYGNSGSFGGSKVYKKKYRGQGK